MSMQLINGAAVLVDQNAFHQRLLSGLLRSSGFSRVIECDDLENGLEEVSRSHTDFLFADFDTARESEILRGNANVRQSHLPQETNLIFLMQNTTRKRVKTAIAHGAQWVISRPFSPNSLNQRIHATLAPHSVATVVSDRDRPDVDVIELSIPPKETEEERIDRMLREMDTLLKNSHYYDPDLADDNASKDSSSDDKFFLS